VAIHRTQLARVIAFILVALVAIHVKAPCQIPAGKQDGDRPVSAAGSLPAEEASAGWIRLFDGLTSAGWQFNAPSKPWKISNAEFISSSGTVVSTLAQFSAYELQFEYLLGPESAAQFLGGFDGSSRSAESCYALTLSNSNGVDTPWRRITLRTVPGGFAVFSLDSELQVARPQRLETGGLGFRTLKGSFKIRKMRLRPVVQMRPAISDKRSPITASPASFTGFRVGEKSGITVNGSGGELQFPVPSGVFVFQSDMLIVDGYGRIRVQSASDPGNGFKVALDPRCVGIDHTRPLETGTGGYIGGPKTREIVADSGQPFTISLVCWRGGSAVYVNGYFTASRSWRTTDAGLTSVISLSADTTKANIKFSNLRLSLPAAGQNGNTR
jgi:hypothetical protein